MQRGVGSQLLKVGNKRRRTMTQIKADKDEAACKQHDIEEKLAAFEKLQAQTEELQAQIQQHQAASDIINDLVGKGEMIIDEVGNVSISKSKE